MQPLRTNDTFHLLSVFQYFIATFENPAMRVILPVQKNWYSIFCIPRDRMPAPHLASLNTTFHHAGEMHSEEWEVRIRNRVNKIFNEILFFFF